MCAFASLFPSLEHLNIFCVHSFQQLTVVSIRFPREFCSYTRYFLILKRPLELFVKMLTGNEGLASLGRACVIH